MLLTACSIPTEELSDAISKKVEDEVTKVVDKATEEGKKKAEEALTEGLGKVDSLIKDYVGSNSGGKEVPPTSDKITAGTTTRIPVKLAKHVDGDTVRIFLDTAAAESLGAKVGKDGSVAVRYLLVDAPETVDPRLNGPQPFGNEASQRNKELLESGPLTLELDIGEKVDHYGRILGHLFVNDISIQETLVKEGLVMIAYVRPPNTRYLDTYENAQKHAKEIGIGIWSLENYADSKFKDY